MRKLFFFLLFALSGQSFAVDYYWQTATNNTTYESQRTGSTPYIACENAIAADSWAAYLLPTVINQTATSAQCQLYDKRTGPSAIKTTINVTRMGDSCPVGLTFNVVTGACEGDPCAVKNGQSQRFQKASATPDGYGVLGNIGGKPIFIPQTSACFSGCAVSTTDQKCVARVSGAYICRGTAYYTGVSCETGGAAQAPVEATTQSDPVPADTVKTDLPCKYVSNPDGSQTCTSITAKESEGLQCGTVNGQQTCVSKNPTKDETKIDTKVTTSTNPDGSTTTTKTDTQTKTKCPSYLPTCTSTTTTTTTTTTKNAAGDLIASDQTCTGSNCSSSGNPDANGDGFGDCTGDNCGEGKDGKPSNKPTMPKLDGAPSYADSLNSFQQKIKAAPIYAAVGGLSVPSGGACSFGSAQTFFGAISFDDFCAIAPQILNPLRYLFLAIWAWAAIRLFFTA